MSRRTLSYVVKCADEISFTRAHSASTDFVSVLSRTSPTTTRGQEKRRVVPCWDWRGFIGSTRTYISPFEDWSLIISWDNTTALAPSTLSLCPNNTPCPNTSCISWLLTHCGHSCSFHRSLTYYCSDAKDTTQQHWVYKPSVVVHLSPSSLQSLWLCHIEKSHPHSRRQHPFSPPPPNDEIDRSYFIETSGALKLCHLLYYIFQNYSVVYSGIVQNSNTCPKQSAMTVYYCRFCPAGNVIGEAFSLVY